MKNFISINSFTELRKARFFTLGIAQVKTIVLKITDGKAFLE